LDHPSQPSIPKTVSQWENAPRSLAATAAVLLVLVLTLFIVAYRYGIPMVGRFVAERLPASVSVAVSDNMLASLDEHALRPSRVSGDRQRALTAAFLGLRTERRAAGYRLLFRESEAFGANAVALPSGIIIVTDALINLAHDDREILGVLAHEAGHVEHRHGMRLVLQTSVLTLVVGWVVGDFGSIIALAPTALMQAHYSRDFEREADASAAAALRRSGISPAVLADMLERIESSERGRASQQDPESPAMKRIPSDRDTRQPTPPEETGDAGNRSLFDYAATHPATSERLEYLRSK
jgi:Zn-dependent protease with chaperone function